MKEVPTPQQGRADATARKSRCYSKEEPMLQQGSADATARKCRCYSKEVPATCLRIIGVR